jgi:hypothetical protein
MNNGAKAAIGATAVLILAVGGQLAWLHHERNAPVAVKAPEREVIADDDLVFLKKKRPDTLKDMKELVGSTVWVSAGGQMEFYPYAGHAVQYGKNAGTLLGAEPIVVKDAVEQVAPKTANMRCPSGIGRPGNTRFTPMRFFSTMIRTSYTSTGGRRSGRPWIRTR